MASTPSIGQRHQHRATVVAAVWWTILFCFNVVGCLPWLRVAFPTVDLAAMVYDLERLRSGYVPYRDTFNHHFVGYIVPFYWLSTVVAITPVVLRITALCCHFATAICVFLIIREIGRKDLAWLGAFLAVTTGWFWRWQGFAFNVQSCLEPVWAFLLLLVVRAASRSSRGAVYGGALTAGTLVCFDQRALLFVPLVAIPVLFVQSLRRIRTIGVAALFTALVPALCAIYLWTAGAWSDFIRQTVVFPLYFRNYGLPADVPFALVWLVFVAISEPIAAPLALAGAIWAAIADRRPWFRVLLPASFLCAIGYSVAGGRIFPNYFILLGTTMLVSIGLMPLYADRQFPRAGVALRAALLIVGAAAALKPLELYRATGSVFVPRTENTVEAAAEFVKQNSSAADGILVWGFAPQIYVLSGRFNSFKDATLLSITGGNFASVSTKDQGLLPEMLTSFEEYLSRRPPKFIVVYTHTRVPVGPCAGKGMIQRNLDFTQVPHLWRLRDLIAASYSSRLVTLGLCDRTEVFVKQSEAPRVGNK